MLKDLPQSGESSTLGEGGGVFNQRGGHASRNYLGTWTFGTVYLGQTGNLEAWFRVYGKPGRRDWMRFDDVQYLVETVFLCI